MNRAQTLGAEPRPFCVAIPGTMERKGKACCACFQKELSIIGGGQTVVFYVYFVQPCFQDGESPANFTIGFEIADTLPVMPFPEFFHPAFFCFLRPGYLSKRYMKIIGQVTIYVQPGICDNWPFIVVYSNNTDRKFWWNRG